MLNRFQRVHTKNTLILQKNIWYSDGLTNNKIKEIKINNTNNIDTSLIYTQGISSIDYTKVSVEIKLKNNIRIIQKNNTICIYFNVKEPVLKVIFENDDIEVEKTINIGNSYILSLILLYYAVFMATMIGLVFVEYIKMKIRQKKFNNVKL